MVQPPSFPPDPSPPRHAVPAHAAPGHHSRLNRPWLHSLGFTLALVGLVAVAAGGEWAFSLTAILACAVGFGFFYLLFPGGLHFGVVVANFLAIYACMFVFFRESNFRDAPGLVIPVALILPLLGFLGGCILHRRSVSAMLRARHTRDTTQLPHLGRWVPFTLAIGMLTFALPHLHLPPRGQGWALLISMGVIAVAVFAAARDVVLLQIDVALLFENVTIRLRALVMPMVAFLTMYALLVVVFACLYRIAEMITGSRQLAFHGTPISPSFPDTLYFSLITISTVGYGDYAPIGPLARVLASIEVVTGLLLLLFGVSEIVRGARAGYGQGPGPNMDRMSGRWKS